MATYTLHLPPDAKLMQRTGLDEVTLFRLRKEFHGMWNGMPHNARKDVANGGTAVRFGFMVIVMENVFAPEQLIRWQAYTEHSKQDYEEMMVGQYPISPYLIRLHSALFGIKVDFLLLGSNPQVDKLGGNIDVWPITKTR